MNKIMVVNTKNAKFMAQYRRSLVTMVAVKGKEGGHNGVPWT